MFERLTCLAEKLATRASLSRRGFLGRLAKGALATVGAVGALVGYPAVAQTDNGRCYFDEDCQFGQWCAKAAGDCDGKGRCIPIPVDLFCLDVYLPVCGCDGRTYSNACYAFINAVNVAYEGECEA
jgi:hypothetical protein